MDSHSATFDFGANMDFGSAFAAPQQQQQAFMKPLEDNTSTFFFGDEGIDTTTGFDQTFDALNPALLSTPHDMQQTLVSLHFSYASILANCVNSPWITPRRALPNGMSSHLLFPI
jgi:hypothetical protein